jgi:hypothetical protein
MCTLYSRGMIISPGNGPPKMPYTRYVPITGAVCTNPAMARMPVPESRSSGRE